ncbi:insulinase family protein, partial [Candidatus Peregrinibacteria bacterium]|nr:insulinase family protein [Candidatus Peregrinibacteria bacterium]
KEYAGYYVKVASEHIHVAMDVLSDMLVNSKFASDDIDRERGVILEEYNMYQDTPIYQVGWNFERLLFGDQPMGWSQVGTKELIQGVKHEDFVKYKESLYTPDNIVMSVVGNVDDRAVLDMVSKYFVFSNEKKQYKWKPYKKVSGGERVFLHHKKTEQAHVVIGFYGYPETHKDHYAEKVLSVLLGGNMSSRMFLSVREKLGLAYYISTTTDDYHDIGVISTRAGVDVRRIDDAVTAICGEYRKVVEFGVSEAEIVKAKEFLKGKLTLRLEDSEEYAHLLGKYELLHDAIKMPKEIIAGIDKVSASDVMRVAKDLFTEDRLRMALIGPYEDKQRFEARLKF